MSSQIDQETREKKQITNIINEKSDITTDPTDIK